LHLKPTFLKFDYFPYANLKGPYFGVGISETIEPTRFKYFSLRQEDSIGRIWLPPVISKELSIDEQETQKDFLEDLTHKNERGYIITKEPYKTLGSLIPLIELPSLSFLIQSEDLRGLEKRIQDSQKDIGSIRLIAAQNLKRIFNPNQ